MPYSHRCSIVFVHGLFGHPEDTWTGVRDKAPLDLSTYPAVLTEPQSGNTSKSVSFWKKGKNRLRPTSSDDRKNADSNSAISSDPIVPRSNLPDTLFWPKELLPIAIPEARIYTWGYDVDINHVFANAGQATTFQHSTTLLSDLANERVSVEDVSEHCFHLICLPLLSFL